VHANARSIDDEGASISSRIGAIDGDALSDRGSIKIVVIVEAVEHSACVRVADAERHGLTGGSNRAVVGITAGSRDVCIG